MYHGSVRKSLQVFTRDVTRIFRARRTWVIVVGVILIMGGLTFFPALTLGPIAEQFESLSGHLF